MARSKPSARPKADGSTASASSAFRAGTRSPRAVQAPARRRPTCQADVARPIPADRIAVAVYPPTATLRRRPGSSASAPPTSLAMPLSASAISSIRAEHRGRSAEHRGEKRWQERGRDFVAEVRQEARETDPANARGQHVGRMRTEGGYPLGRPAEGFGPRCYDRTGVRSPWMPAVTSPPIPAESSPSDTAVNTLGCTPRSSVAHSPAAFVVDDALPPAGTVRVLHALEATRLNRRSRCVGPAPRAYLAIAAMFARLSLTQFWVPDASGRLRVGTDSLPGIGN